ncbi:Phosphatidylinositol-glycan biosynthesis class F protein [Varanus komodoensis]|nr:Phosphatidylinositol-glycan biosynthesis class F protein [Varanus komodoensis]
MKDKELKRLLSANVSSIASVIVTIVIPYLLVENFSIYGTHLTWLCICSAAVGAVTIILHIILKPNPSNRRSSLAHKVARFLRCCVYFCMSCIFYHGIIVLYGAPLMESVLETFLFAVLLSTFTTLHCLCLLGPNIQVWLRVFSKNGLLTGTGRYAHMTPVLHQLHWLPIEARAQFKVLIMTYKALNGLGPGYLNERLRPYMPDRPLRSAGESLLREPSMKEIRRVSTRRRAFSAVAPNLWNSLPKEVRLAPSLLVFWRQSHIHLGQQSADYNLVQCGRSMVWSISYSPGLGSTMAGVAHFLFTWSHLWLHGRSPPRTVVDILEQEAAYVQKQITGAKRESFCAIVPIL